MPDVRYTEQTPAIIAFACDALELGAAVLDLALEPLPVPPQSLQQTAQASGKVVLGVFEHERQLPPEGSAAGSNGDVILEQERADLVDHGGAVMNEALSGSMQCLQVELLGALDQTGQPS